VPRAKRPSIADIILEILQRWHQGDNAGLRETYHCTAQGETSWAGFARYVFAVSKEAGGPSALVQGIPSEEWPTKARRPKNSRLDCLKLAGELGLSLPHWKDSVKLVVERLCQ
jgi:dTDP-4-dehydrorhamnose reductase